MDKSLFNQDPEKIILENRIKELETENKNFKDELNQVKKEIFDFEFLRPDKTFGIAVSGDVLLNNLEVQIVNSYNFQRLRKIKQLGSTNLVFPSANHNRFEHSLGVLKVADTIIRNIKNNQHSSEDEKKITPEEEQIIRLLALLHDIGHMPYGHTIEDEFGIFRSHDKHETRWDYFLSKNSEIGKIIIENRDETFHNRFYQLIKCEKDFKGFESDAYMYDIISNTVCADLLDYLERDCFFTNLQLKHHPRFLNYFFIKNITKSIKRDVDGVKTNVEINEKRIAIRVYKKGKKELRRDIISELIQLLRNRYYLGERVYYHHAKIKTGTMLAASVARAHFVNAFEEIEIKNPLLEKSIKVNSDNIEDKKLYNIHLMGDDELINYLKNLKIPIKEKLDKTKDNDKIKKIEGAVRLANLFNERFKYKELIYQTKDDLGIEDKYDTEVINKNKNKKAKHYIADKLNNQFIKFGSARDRLNIEDTLCDYLEIESGDILIYCPNFNMAMKLAKANIEDDKREIHELWEFNDTSTRNECKSIIDKHQALWALRVFVNPKYIDETHPDYKLEYEDYKELITKYSNWAILAKTEAQEKEMGKMFWSSYIEYLLTKFENDGHIIESSPLVDKKKKTKELVNDFIEATYGDRKFNTVVEKIKNKFNIKTI